MNAKFFLLNVILWEIHVNIEYFVLHKEVDII